MPDTHLVMPCTLSAPYAELLEAETPQTMTASDATNGTAAAAAAFARLLASGDHAMQPESSPITEVSVANAPACDTAHRPHDLRTMLLGSTSLPRLGMTIAEASQKTAELLAEVSASNPISDDKVDAIFAEVDRLETAVIGLEPQTIPDAACILDRIFPIDARANLDRDIPAIRRVAAFLHQIAEAARSFPPVETSIIPSIGMTFRQAADRVHEMVERANNSPRGEDDGIEDKAELERQEAARDADCREWGRILDAIMSTPAQTVGDLFVKVERLACPSLGIRQVEYLDAEVLVLQEDVKRLQSLWGGIGPSAVGEGHSDADILALGRRRAELIERIDQPNRSDHEVAPLLIEWKEVDHLIMELTPRTGAGLAVQLAVIWRLLDAEPGEEDGPTANSALDRVWLWTAMQNAERIGGGAQLAHDRQDADAPIFAAYSRWSELVQDCYAAKTDDDCEHLSEQADEAALDVMTHEPATREGLAAQVFVMLHLEHGGTTDDHLDIDFSPLTGGDGPDNAAVQALVERVKRIGRRDGAYEPYAVAMEKRIGTAANDQLRQAWEELYRLDTECVPDDLDDWAACEAYNRSVDEACKRVLAAPVQTVADISFLARFALRGVTVQWGACETEPQELAARDQIPTDRGQQLMVALWRIVEHLTRQQHIATQLAPVFQQDDDADLLNAFNEWLTAARSLDAIPIEASEEEREPYCECEEEAVRRLLNFSPKTPRGTAAILRYLFLRSAGAVGSERVILHGGEPNDEDLADFLPQILWPLIKALEALPTAANDQHQNADAFADTVAAFEAEAPATLALPLEPTGGMVDAGASAAGITPAQFQAAYAAAVEALKLERAA